MEKTYRVLSARHARAIGLEVGGTYEKEYHPSLERALLVAGHAELVNKKADAASSKEKHDG